jgi:hypothetical protein
MACECDSEAEDPGSLAPAFSQLTPDWFTPALRSLAIPSADGPARVVDLRATRLGVGHGFLASLHRVEMTWAGGAGPRSVVVKVAATGERSRAVATGLDLYRNEVYFYRDLAAHTDLAVGCYHAAVDEAAHDFVLVLEDMTGTTVVDQVDGCPADHAAIVVTALADHHARFWDEAGLDAVPWLRRLDDTGFIDALAAAVRASWPTIRRQRAGRLDESTIAIGDRLADLLPRLAADLSRPPRTLAHGDARLDNMFFDPGRRWIRLCDWQLTDRSRGLRDVGFFVSQSLTPGERARLEGRLVERYVARLAEHGITGYSMDDAWEDYRTAVMLAFVYAVVAVGGLDHDVPRSHALTESMLDRSAAAIADHWGTPLI